MNVCSASLRTIRYVIKISGCWQWMAAAPEIIFIEQRIFHWTELINWTTNHAIVCSRAQYTIGNTVQLSIFETYFAYEGFQSNVTWTDEKQAYLEILVRLVTNLVSISTFIISSHPDWPFRRAATSWYFPGVTMIAIRCCTQQLSCFWKFRGQLPGCPLLVADWPFSEIKLVAPPFEFHPLLIGMHSCLSSATQCCRSSATQCCLSSATQYRSWKVYNVGSQ